MEALLYGKKKGKKSYPPSNIIMKELNEDSWGLDIPDWDIEIGSWEVNLDWKVDKTGFSRMGS